MRQKSATRGLIAADLAAATGRTGSRAALSAVVFEPGFCTVWLHRRAVALQFAGWPRFAKLLWRVNVATSSCHLHLDSQIGPGLKLPHPSGVVIGAGARLGANVTVYQHVTLGRSLREERYPDVGDGAVLYPNAVIVGGIVIGQRAIVGAGAVVTADVPDDAVVAGNPAQIVRMQSR